MPDTIDKLLNGKVKLQQPVTGYRAAIDPILLAAAVPARSGQNVLELGCGAGAALFCLAARVPDLFITGIELQVDYAACATANCTHNAGLGHVTIMTGDVRHLPPHVAANSFDHVFMNPPYYHNGGYDSGESTAKTTAHAMDETDLPHWVKSAHGRLKHRGSLTIIYRADGLADLLAAMAEKFGGLTVLPLWPRAGIQAKRVIVQGMKGSKAPLKLLAGLILHEDQDYSAAASSILSAGQALIME